MKWSIGKKMTIGFGVATAALVGVAVLNFVNLKNLSALQDEGSARSDDAVTVQEGVGMADKIYAVAAAAMITGDVRTAKADWAELTEEMREDLAAFNKLVRSDSGKRALKSAEAEAASMMRIAESEILSLAAGDATEENIAKMQDAHGRILSHMAKMEDALTEMAGIVKEDRENFNEEIDAAASGSIQAVLLIAALGLILSLGTAVFVTRGITGPVRKIAGAAERLALGEVDLDVSISSSDEIGDLAGALMRLVEAQRQKTGVAEQIAEGNLEVDAEVLSDKDTLAKAMNQMKAAILKLAEDANTLSSAAVEGRLDVRADALEHDGEFAQIINGFNETVDTLVGHLDSMPAPAMIIDRDFNIQYMNSAGASVIGRSQEELRGTKCFDQFKTADCHTDKCACARAMKNERIESSETESRAGGHTLEIQYTGVPMKDLNGKIIGAFEVVADQTAVKAAARLAEKRASYQKVEVQKLVESLGKVAVGDLDISTDIAPTDGDTKEIGDNFSLINEGLKGTASAVRGLVEDANMLAEAAVEGRLDTRADLSRHQGDFQRIVSGVNMTLDAVLDPINEAASVLEKLSAYDLTARVTGSYEGDHAKIKNSLNATANALHDAMAQVAEAADQVSSASTQIASSSQQVAEGASEQASSLEETSSALEEMSGMTKQNADNTQQAKGIAETTRAAADKGASAMQNMLGSMDQIKRAAEGTAAIIKDINDIAFQTNLLALNAAVEAARAGDAGRGFAVVAEEVRNLAGRAKEAAKNTEDLIKESVRLADDGQGISGQVNENLSEIVQSVGKVTDIVAEIAVASQEQARGIEQVNKAVNEMDKVVQQSAANSEESSSAAEELAGQAQEMAAMVGRFQLNRSHSGQSTSFAVTKSGSGKKKTKTAAARSAESDMNIPPEALIPMESDPDFAEF